MKIEEIIEKYYKLIYKICLDMLKVPQDAEDAMQDTYFNMYKNFTRYQNLQENELKNILCKIALNRCKDILKSKSYILNKNCFENDILEIEKYTSEDKMDEDIIVKENKQVLLNAISSLKQPYSVILKYYYIDGLKLDELEKVMKVSKYTLKVQLYRGKNMLKENLIKDKGGGYFEEYGYKK